MATGLSTGSTQGGVEGWYGPAASLEHLVMRGPSICPIRRRLVLLGGLLLAAGCAPKGGGPTGAEPPSTPEQAGALAAVDALAAGEYGTGIGLADLDGDLLPELILASGNDMEPGPVLVFSHTGDPDDPYGPPPEAEGTRGFYGDLCIGDVDGDALLDVAVVRAWDADLDTARGGIDVFLNQGGTLAAVPDPTWSVQGFVPFACDFGDIDGDGRLDLGVAVFWDRGGQSSFGLVRQALCEGGERGPLRVYRNTGAGFEPMWESSSREGFIGLSFDDVDRDQRLDLTAVGRRVQTWLGEAGTLQDAPAVVSDEDLFFPFGVDVAHLGGPHATAIVPDGCPTYACTGRYLAYELAPSDEPVAPVLTTEALSMPGPAGFVDLDQDGRPDLIGSTWGPSVIDQGDPQQSNPGDSLLVYRGRPGGVSSTPCAMSRERLITQHLAAGAIRPGAATSRVTEYTAGDSGALIDLGARPLHVDEVTVAGESARFAWTPEHRWVSVAGAAPGDAIVVRWQHRPARDLAVANWKGDPGGAVVYTPERVDWDCDGLDVAAPPATSPPPADLCDLIPSNQE